MNIVLWIAAFVLAAVFAGAGFMKLTQSKAQIVATPRMGWAESFPPGLIKTIGALEVLAAIGLILPALIDVATVVVPLAATGLVLMMVGAATVHGRRREYQSVAMNLVLLLLAAFVAWGRFGPHAF